MKFTEVSRTATDSGEVLSIYNVGNTIINLTSRFNDKIQLEDAMYQIILQRVRSQKQSEEKQEYDRKFNNYMV